MNRAKRQQIFERLKQHNPQPRTELNYASAFELLVAVILSAQATDRSVNLATAALFRVANDPESMLSLGEAGLREYIKSIGLYKNKARHIMRSCRMLLERHDGKVPDNREALEALPGVGRKTANVILNTWFGEATVAVDTHIFRVANRTGIARGKTPLAVEKGLLRHVPKPYLRDAHHWLILHGRYTCVARKPRCGECIIADLCDYPDRPRGGTR